jgi:hypothetical protein
MDPKKINIRSLQYGTLNHESKSICTVFRTGAYIIFHHSPGSRMSR